MIKFVPAKASIPLVVEQGDKVNLQFPCGLHKPNFMEFVRRNKKYHEPWVFVSDTPQYFDQYLDRLKKGGTTGFFVFDNESDNLVGVINLNSIRLEPFSSASLGYYADEKQSGKGYMKEAITLVLRHAFKKIGLNRIEANIQPGNTASVSLIKSLGFTKEGFSKKYLLIGSEYQDHERWAFLAEDYSVDIVYTRY